MASSSNDATTGHPIFDDADAPDLAVNPTEVAAFAAEVGTRLIGDTADRTAYTYAREGLGWYDTTLDTEYLHNGSGWVPARGYSQEAYTWSRSNVDLTPQYPELVADGTNTTDSSLSSFQRVSGTDPDGVGGVKIAVAGVYHISASVVIAAATGRSFIQIGADSDFYRMRASVSTGEDFMSVNHVVRTTAVDQVIPIWFYKQNSSLGTNTGRVLVRRLG